MNRNGPIIIIEDDEDDISLTKAAFKELGHKNPIIFFTDGEEALAHLNRTDLVPFLILSDIAMPKLDGFELRDKIKTDANLQLKCIPYLFFTNASTQQDVINAYSKSVQGFFIKGTTFEEIKETFGLIMDYWLRCSAPNRF